MVDKKCIFITGAGSGIGRETARFFASKGWFTGLFDIHEARLSSLAREIGPVNCCRRIMGVTRIVDVQEAVKFFSDSTGGRMDVLFNCAGILSMGPHAGTPIEVQKTIVDVNFCGILNCINAGFDLLSATQGGCIINMSSASSVYGTPELAVYSATKFAVSGLTEALNIEFEPHGIRVSDVSAPYVRTPMITDAKTRAGSVDRLGIRLTPQQVAAVVWKAAHGNRVHWRVGLMLKLLIFFIWAFPFMTRTLVKWLAFDGEKQSE
jgi:NADP-dependent 3-hydroxy acid dehydrogenase YdfG